MLRNQALNTYFWKEERSKTNDTKFQLKTLGKEAKKTKSKYTKGNSKYESRNQCNTKQKEKKNHVTESCSWKNKYDWYVDILIKKIKRGGTN